MDKKTGSVSIINLTDITMYCTAKGINIKLLTYEKELGYLQQC